MKTSLKRLTTGLSALGLSLSLALPSVAQSQSRPNAETTPANTPETPAPGNRDSGVPPIGGQSGQNTPGTITSPDNSQNNGGTTTNPAVPNNQSVPGTVAPANRPENNNLPGTSTPGSTNTPGGTINNPGVPNNQSVPGVVAPANRPENNNLPGSSSTTTTPSVSFSGSENQSIDQIVRTSPSFELFNALLRVAESNGSFTALSGSGDVTVFAPTDEALAALPPATFKALVQPENRALLVQVLENHIVRGKVTSADLASKQVRSLGGNELAAQGGAGALSVGNAQVIGADIQAENGIIHAVNGVILPAELQSRLTTLAPQAGTVTP